MDGEAVVKFTKTNDEAGFEVDVRFLIGSSCDLMRLRCESVLAKQGYGWELAVDGFKALEAITMCRFSAIFLDQSLRYLTGSHLVSLSSFIPSLRNTPMFVFCPSKQINSVKNNLDAIDLVSVYRKPPSAQSFEEIFRTLRLVR